MHSARASIPHHRSGVHPICSLYVQQRVASRFVRVSDLRSGVTEDDVEDAFCPYGDIDKVELSTETSATVIFRTVDSATAAIADRRNIQVKRLPVIVGTDPSIAVEVGPNRAPGPPRILKHVVLLGNPNVGVSSLLNSLTNKPGEYQFADPEITPTMNRWVDYSPHVDGIMYIIDADTPDSLQEARTELQTLLQDANISVLPVVVLANKAALPGPEDEATLKLFLGITCTGKGDRHDVDGRPLELFFFSLASGGGYEIAARWIRMYLD
ncbi:hypothetical protein PFISCL1PPCAC_3060 [Pristionchus fissidentatus]|uniref:small monomeric GTPase n=1 Tax=Pristionchus fissidentatus TaxID=1538716 RepID=A0AAV5UYD0_9BILA|nr:hypothetical protein PFISCL1PPCAC_3060 [Pristionchus fissidentatus]